MRIFSKILNDKTILFDILTLLIGLGIVLFVFNFSKTYSVCFEDMCQIFFNNFNIIELYRNADHGCLISWILLKTVGSVFPLITNVHPNCNWLGSIFIGIDVALFIFLLSSFGLIFSKNKILRPAWYLLAISIVLQVIMFNPVMIEMYSKHFRYFFTLIFCFLFWLNYIKVFVKQENHSRNIVFISIIGFCTGLSVEPVNLSTLFSLIFLGLIQVFILWFREKNIKNVFVAIKKTNISIYLPLIYFLIGLVFFYLNPEFWRIANDRDVSSNINNFSYIATVLPEFTSLWFNSIFINVYHKFVSISLIILSILVFYINKNKQEAKRVIYVSFSLIFGICIFCFTLLLAGKTFYDGVNFWLVSRDLDFVIYCIFACANIVLLGYLIKEIMDIVQKNVLINIFLSVLSVILLISTYSVNKTNYYARVNYCISFKKLVYQAEKMYVYYALKNETAFIPEFSDIYKDAKEIILGSASFYTPDNVSWFIDPYYKRIYKKDKYVDIKGIPEEQAMQRFYDKGGVFEEGEIEKANFNLLLDEDFVLNKKTKKL